MSKVPRLIEKFIPNHYNLSLDIDRPARKFAGTVTIEGEIPADSQQISLHSKGLTIDTALINGKQADYKTSEFDELIITHPDIRPGEIITTIGFSGELTDAMHGMYPCYFEHNGVKKELVATQFESHHAREVFPCVDEPEAKATFDLTLTTENNITVLSNMNPVSQTVEDDRLVSKFATTPKMSTYLLAWAYGELQKKSGHTKNGVEVNIYATPAQKPESLDFALDHAIKSIDFFDEYFGTKYPLPKSDHIALPDFSSGAMENWGLITYRESTLLADPANTTLGSKQFIATVISHELSHQWFGNLVTMKWWNDLWLNESFAANMEHFAVDVIHPEWNDWLEFSAHDSIISLRRDAIDGVQPIRVDVNHPDEISSLFDPAIVYAKGARLMRMCQKYIGEEAFRAGLQSYFKEFAYKNTVADDLWRHLSEASGKDISKLMNTWISQSGYPVVKLEDNKISQEQFFIGQHDKSEQIWPIPLNSNDNNLPELLDQASLEVKIRPDTRLNIGDSAHFITEYTPEHLANILKSDLDELSRLQLLHEQTLLIRAGRKSSADIIDLLQAYSNETAYYVWDIMAIAFGELKKFVETDKASELALRKFAGQLAKPLYQKLGWDKIKGESEENTKLRPIIIGLMVYSQDEAVLDKVDQLFASGIESIDPEIRPIIIGSVVYRSTDDKLIKDLMTQYSTTTSHDLRDDLCAGLTNVRKDSQIDFLIKQLTDTQAIRLQDNARWFVYLMRNRYSRDSAWQWMCDNWSWIDQQFGSDKSYDLYPHYSAGGIVTTTGRDNYQAFFADKRQIPALTRTIDLGLAEINARLDLLDRDGQAVRDKLAQL